MCFRHCRRERRGQGFTLIEVLAGLVLLGSLLAGALIAKARFTRQQSDAQRKLQAVQAADALLSDWWRDRATLPRDAAGETRGAGGMTWRTRTQRHRVNQTLDVMVTRLEIASRDAKAYDAPLLAVELVTDAALRENNPR